MASQLSATYNNDFVLLSLFRMDFESVSKTLNLERTYTHCKIRLPPLRIDRLAGLIRTSLLPTHASQQMPQTLAYVRRPWVTSIIRGCERIALRVYLKHLPSRFSNVAPDAHLSLQTPRGGFLPPYLAPLAMRPGKGPIGFVTRKI